MKVFLLVSCFALLSPIFSQESTSYKIHKISVKKDNVASPQSFQETYDANLIYHEAPFPGGNSVKSHILQQKIKSRKMYPIKKSVRNKAISSTPSPALGQSFGLEKYINGNTIAIYGGIPNDNTLAVSDGGIVLVGINSLLYAYSLETNALVFTSQTVSLNSMANDGPIAQNYFDPKVIYDKKADRFILVFLKNSSPATNRIIVCFSTTNNPNDSWNVYSLPGNPLNNNRWTDFPAISMTETDLFITGNLIIPNVSWQVGFDGSVIWQVEKEKGYNGDTTLNTILYNDIKFGGNFIRDLHLVQGADGAVDEQYLLSNRNFDVVNDSIFILHVEGSTVDTGTTLSISVHQSDLNYGMPPNGRQFDTDTTDQSSGLQTNDARVLGAIKIGDDVQFVSNTINPSAGYAAIYHGSISSIADQPVITAKIIGDTVKDYGYPNIAWTGNEACDIETIISFNYTSFTDFPGIACVYYDNNGSYSDERLIKAGANYINRLSGTYERWGDYFGLQRYYKKPGRVLSFGYYAKFNKINSAWCAELISPDTSRMDLIIERDRQAALCQQTITINITGGVPPYTYSWSNNSSNNTNSTTNICLGDSAEVTVTDSRGCSFSRVVYGESIELVAESTVYPNPFSSQFAVQFYLDGEYEVTARIYDLTGRMVADLLHRNAKTGLNEIVFSLLPLSAGEYILKIEADGNEIVTEKILKYE